MIDKDWEKIRHFKQSEFACPCCGKCDMSWLIVSDLDELREKYGKPIIVTSGYRCPAYNMVMGGAPNSAHLRGLAADIKVRNDYERYLILYHVFRLNFVCRIGIARNFIHLDADVKLPHPRVWVY